jgi:hypothetical protein
MLEPTIIKPAFRILQRELVDEGEIFSGVYIDIEDSNMRLSFEGVASRAEVTVGDSPNLTKSLEIRAIAGGRKLVICFTHEIVEMIEEILCRR